MTVPLRALLVNVLLIASCAPQVVVPVSTSSVPPTVAPTLAPAARPSPVEHAPRLLLTVPYAPSVEALGATTARVGGISAVGATTFAVDEQERVYVWDRARLRVVVYQAGKFVRAMSLPYVEPDARSLLVHGDRLYLRFTSGFSGSMEYEVDASTGRLLQAVRLGTTIYPRSRSNDVRVGLPPSGQITDAFNNSYVLDGSTPVQRYSRIHPSGATLAYAVEPLAQKVVDMYARADGALYELASDGGGVGSAYVYALIPPIGAAPAPAVPIAPASPVAFGGRPVPDQLVATIPRAGSVELDAAARLAFWWLASTGVENASLGPSGREIARFEARWTDGSRLLITSDGPGISDGTKSYLTPTYAWAQLAGSALASPPRISALASASATVRITDVAGTEHVLTPTELSTLRASLATAFSVSEGELPGDLERPFPVYEITIGDTVVQLRRDHYAAVSRSGAFAHDGGLSDLVRRSLPVPALAIDDPCSLFLAERVSIEEDGVPSMTGDITRWKASLVRTLTGIETVTNPYPDTRPLTFTFAFAGGRTERVRVLADTYTYRGTSYPRPGILGIVGYRGVP